MQNQTSHKQKLLQWNLETRNSPVPCPGRPPPTCPAASRQRPSCAPRGACRGVGLPVGTRGLPRIGGRDLLPRGSRWSTEVWKHEKSPSSGPLGHGKGRISQQRPPFLDYGENIHEHTIPSARQALFELTGCQEASIYSIYSQCLLTLLARSHETTLGRPRTRLRLGWSVIISNIVKRPRK